jgi:L,D-transpeptidase ErfK/SrfK
VWRLAVFGWIVALSTMLAGTPAPADNQPAVSVVSLEHVVAPKQTLRSIASRHGVDPGVLAAENGRSRTQPLRAGEVLTVRVGHIVPAATADGVVIINIPQRMLFFRGPDGLLAIPIAVGRPDWRTPISPFTIVEKELDPTWDVPVSIAREAAAKGTQLPPRVEPGPDNPLGRHWLRLSVGGIGLHGTNAPSSIYQAVTHGCIRVHPDDIARLFSLLDVGAKGEIVYEPVQLAVEGDDLFVEVHRDIYGLLRQSPLEILRSMATDRGLADRIDWKEAGQVVAAREGIARTVTMRTR